MTSKPLVGSRLRRPGTHSWWRIFGTGRHSETEAEFYVLSTEDGQVAWAIEAALLGTWQPPREQPDFNVQARSIIAGQSWRHHKGGVYIALGVVRSWVDDIDLMLYRQAASQDLWLRPLSMWFETVPGKGSRFAVIEAWKDRTAEST